MTVRSLIFYHYLFCHLQRERHHGLDQAHQVVQRHAHRGLDPREPKLVEELVDLQQPSISITG